MTKDILGREIAPGDYVAQRGIDNRRLGANNGNRNHVGRVDSITEGRARVRFPTWNEAGFNMPGEFLVIVRKVDGRWTPDFDPEQPALVTEPTVRDKYVGPETSPFFRPEGTQEPASPVTVVLDAMRDKVTGRDVLAVRMQENGADANTIKDYLLGLLSMFWDEKDNFSSKKPFGSSGWHYDLYAALIHAGLIDGEFDEDDLIAEVDTDAGNALIKKAIKALGES